MLPIKGDKITNKRDRRSIQRLFYITKPINFKILNYLHTKFNLDKRSQVKFIVQKLDIVKLGT